MFNNDKVEKKIPKQEITCSNNMHDTKKKKNNRHNNSIFIAYRKDGGAVHLYTEK